MSNNSLRSISVFLCLVAFLSCSVTAIGGPSDTLGKTLLERHEPECLVPTGVKILDAGDDYIAFRWQGDKPSFYGIRHQARYRKTGESGFGPSSWVYVWAFENNYMRFDHLEKGSEYEFELRRICDGEGQKYTLYSDWVSMARLKMGKTDQDASEYTGEECEALVGGTVSEESAGTFKIKLNVTVPATPGGIRYMVRFQFCQSGSAWIEEFLLDTDSMFVTDNTGTGLCEVEARVILGGYGVNYEQYCPWQQIAIPGGPGGGSGGSGCNVPNNVPDPVNEIPLDELTIGDLVYVASIPMVITDVISGEYPFAGKATISLPFGNTSLDVEFSGVGINDHYEVYSGEVTGIPGDPDDYVHLIPPQNNSVQFKCQERKHLDGFDENGIWVATGLPHDPFGFDANGQYSLEPPYAGYKQGDPIDRDYDPNGFDSEGNHISTGTKYNEFGCSRDSIDVNGNHCDPGRDPYYWLQEDGNTFTEEGKAFYESIKDSLRILIVNALNQKKDELTLGLDDKKLECDKYRDTMDTYIASLNYNADHIKGSGGEYFDDGMSKNFASEPQTLLDDVERSAEQEGLERAHVNLFHCDKEYSEMELSITLIDELLAGELDAIEDYLAQKIKKFTAEEVELYTNPDEFFAWILQQIDEILANGGVDGLAYEMMIDQKDYRLHIEDKGYGPSLGARVPFRYDDDKAMKDEIWNLLWSGNKYINNIHRAFYLEEIHRQNMLMSAVDPTNSGKLPVVLLKETAGSNHYMYMDNVVLTKEGGYCDVYFILDVPNSGDRIVFVAEDIHFGPGGAFSWEVLRIQNDFSIRLNNAANLTIKGTDPGTYISWDCEGFNGIGVVGIIEFCRQYLTPVDMTTKKVIDDPDLLVSAGFSIQMDSWSDFLVQLDYFDPFAITKFPSVFWEVENAVLDFSDLSSPDFPIPPDYESNFVENDTVTDLWKGFYLGSLTAYLPDGFNQSGNSVEFSVRDIIIDDMGFSGYAEVNTSILPLDQGSLAGWAFSIDGINIQVVSNQVTGAGFHGLVNVPIFQKEGKQGGGGVTPEDCLIYNASIYSGSKYSFDVTMGSDYEADIWKASVLLDANSQVSVVYEDDEFVASAMLHGMISVDGEYSSNLKIQIPDIPFNNVVISNKSPYFSPGTWGFPTSIGANLGAFKISIHDVALADGDEEGECKLQFRSKITFSNDHSELAGEVGLNIEGMLNDGYHQRWSFKKVSLTDIGIQCTISGNEIAGSLSFFDEAGIYGTGFRGIVDVKFSALGGATEGSLKALGQFGKTQRADSSRYNYFLVDAVGQWSPGTPLFPGVNLCGISGGLYYHMKRPANPAYTFNNNTAIPPLGSSLSGIVYTPSDSILLGFEIGAVFSVGEESVFNGNVKLGCEFYSGGGMSKVWFSGNAQFMANIDFNVPTTNNKGGTPANNAEINANIDLNYDFASGVFTGELEAYANAAGGAIRGGLDNNKMGYGNIYFGSGWRIWLGTPQNPWKVKLGIPGLASLESTAYFCVGSELPPFGDYPSEVKEITGGFSRSANIAGAGASGFMFGTHFKLSTEEFKFLMFYAQFGAGMGTDIAILNYRDLMCQQTNSAIGINGWYGAGSFYAYIQGKIGINATVFGRKKKFNIIDAQAAVAMEGGLPYPFFARGVVAGKYNILGGLIKGECKFQFELGEPCKPVAGTGDVELDAIEAVIPADGANFISTADPIRVVMNVPLDEPYKVKDFNGITSTYLVTLVEDEIKIIANGLEMPYLQRIAYDGRSVEYLPKYFLPALDTITFKFKVKIVENGGSPTYESREVKYVTGTALAHIPDVNIDYSYPANGMTHFYQKTNYDGNGRLVLHRGQPELFDPSEGEVVAVFVVEDEEISIPVTVEGRLVEFRIPDLPLDTKMKLEIRKLSDPTDHLTIGYVGGGATFGAADATNILYTCEFETSQYYSFEDKIAAMRGHLLANGLSDNTIEVKSSTLTEGFDEMELKGFGEGPLLVIHPQLSKTSWYGEVRPKLYSPIPISYTKPGTSSKETLDITWRRGYIPHLPLMEGLIADVSNEGPFSMKFMFPHYVHTDFNHIRGKLLIMKMESEPNMPVELEKLYERMKLGLPDFTGKPFVLNVIYSLPDDKQAFETITITPF